MAISALALPSPLPASRNVKSKALMSSSLSPKRCVLSAGVGFLAASILTLSSTLEADATRIEYYATVGDPLCEMSYARSGLGFCDLSVGDGVEAPRFELVNIHYTARFADGRVFDSSYKRARPLTMRLGAGKVIKGLDQGILGGGGVPPMQVGGKRKLMIPPELAYGPEPAGCFSGDCNIPANATLLYDIKFVGIYSGNANGAHVSTEKSQEKGHGVSRNNKRNRQESSFSETDDGFEGVLPQWLGLPNVLP